MSDVAGVWEALMHGVICQPMQPSAFASDESEGG